MNSARIPARALALALIFLLLAGPSALATPIVQPAMSTFSDGSVLADGVYYPTRADFLQSDYFRQNGLRCGTPPALNRLNDPEPSLGSASHCTLGQTVIQGEYYLDRAYVIPVVFHVITAAGGVTGNVSDQRIRDQVEVMNQDFRALPGTMGSLGYDSMIQFELVGIDRTANDNWYADNDESGFKSALSWDRQKYLNIYTNTAGGYLGYSYLPQDWAGDVLDGVVIAHDVVGGRNQSGVGEFDQGRTAVHEIGHYLGLDHTFAGGCTNSYTTGDLIVDTNAEDVDAFRLHPDQHLLQPGPHPQLHELHRRLLHARVHPGAGQPHGLLPGQLPLPALQAALPHRTAAAPADPALNLPGPGRAIGPFPP